MESEFLEESEKEESQTPTEDSHIIELEDDEASRDNATSEVLALTPSFPLLVLLPFPTYLACYAFYFPIFNVNGSTLYVIMNFNE